MTIRITEQSSGSSSVAIPELSSDPASPVAQQAWVLKSGGSTGRLGGIPLGLLMLITDAGQPSTSSTYSFSYRTLESTTVRVTLS